MGGADPGSLKKFFVVANLVRQHPVDELVAQLKSRKIISKDQVIRESKHVSSLVNTGDWFSHTCYSEKPRRRYRYSCDIKYHVTQMPALDTEDSSAMPLCGLYS